MAADLRALAGATVVFDLDGTLVDSAPDIAATLNLVLAEEDLPALPLAVARKMVGGGPKVLLERAFAHLGLPADPVWIEAQRERFFALYLERIADETRPYPGCLEALDRLAQAGAVLAVCTNKPTKLSLALLDGLEMSRRFAAIVGPDAAGVAKPDPRCLTHAIAAAGGDSARALLVGDSEFDVYAARAAGVPSVFWTEGYCHVGIEEMQPDASFGDYAALPEICARLLRP